MESGTTGIDWDRYEPYDPGVSDSPRNMQRVEARRLFNASMEAKPERLEFLGQLLKANGLELTSGDEGHSEARILQRIVDEGYSPSQITHLYSDRALSSAAAA